MLQYFCLGTVVLNVVCGHLATVQTDYKWDLIDLLEEKLNPLACVHNQQQTYRQKAILTNNLLDNSSKEAHSYFFLLG